MEADVLHGANTFGIGREGARFALEIREGRRSLGAVNADLLLPACHELVDSMLAPLALPNLSRSLAVGCERASGLSDVTRFVLLIFVADDATRMQGEGFVKLVNPFAVARAKKNLAAQVNLEFYTWQYIF